MPHLSLNAPNLPEMAMVDRSQEPRGASFRGVVPLSMRWLRRIDNLLPRAVYRTSAADQGTYNSINSAAHLSHGADR